MGSEHPSNVPDLEFTRTVDLSVETEWRRALAEVLGSALCHIRLNAWKDPELVFLLADLAHNLPSFIELQETNFQPERLIQEIESLPDNGHLRNSAKLDLLAALRSSWYHSGGFAAFRSSADKIS